MSDLDIIIPFIHRDKERFTVLWDTLEKYLDIPNFNLYLVSPDGKSPISSSRIIPVKEKDLDPNLADNRFSNQGWWKQQIIKLLAHRITSSEFILSLDSDCFLNRSLNIKNIIKNKKCKINLSKDGSWDNWYRGSENVLRLKLKSKDKVGVTPFIFSRHILHGLNNYLDILYNNNTVKNLLELSLQSKTASVSDVWTEYTLYHIYADTTGVLYKYHIQDNNFKLYDNCFWNEKEAESWDPAKSFKNPKHFFTVAQSVSNKSGSWVYEKIKKYL